jgi:hypothetical protein
MDKIVMVGGRASQDWGREIIEVLSAAKSLNADQDCGKVFMLDLAAGFTVTLPAISAAAAGWSCKLMVKTAPITSGGYVITELAASDTNKIITNGINELEVDTTEDGPYNAGHTTITFVHDVALAGDHVEIMCDGTNWYAKGQTKADGGIALA